MATWGTLSWNVGQWGDQANSDVSVSGISLSANIGTVTITSSTEFGWGRSEWGIQTWGEASDVANLTGVSASFSLGSVSIDAEILSGWGGDAWGENGWGIFGDILVTGNALSSNLGSVTTQANSDASVTGQSLTANLASVSITATSDAVPTGSAATLNLGSLTVTANSDLTLSGIAMSANLGTLEGFNSEGWGRYDWGEFDWGVAGEWVFVDVTGVELSATVDTEGAPSFTAKADAQLSTAQAKFGPSSLLLDGTGDFVQSTATDVVQNNFTIEFFAYASNFAQNAYLWDNQSSNQGFAISITSAGQLRLIQDGTILQQTSSPSLNNNQWNHFALVQNSTLLTLFINGTPKLQYSTGGDSYPGQSYKIGANEGETQFFNGYIDEFRSSDIARYTTTFTPTTSAFAVDGNTISLLHFDGANGSTQIFNAVNARTVVTGDASLTLTGIEMTAAEGILDPSPDIILTGVSLTANLGSVVAAINVEVSVTGQALTANLGNETIDLNTPVDLTGFGLTGALGDTNEIGEATTLLTGNALTSTLASANVLIWNEVPTGTDVTYSDVNTGTTVTWSDVDTAA